LVRRFQLRQSGKSSSAPTSSEEGAACAR
jgi:hypothetical protein